MSTTPRRLLNPVVGYTLLLAALTMLGLFTAVLAAGNGVAATVLGIGMVVSLGAAVVCFRAGAADLEPIRALLDSGPVSIWAEPISREEIATYHVRYRGADAVGESKPLQSAERHHTLTAA